MNKNLIITSFLAILFISSCAQVKPFAPNQEKVKAKPANHHSLCAELRRKLIFLSNDVNMDTQWHSPTRRAQLLYEYKKYQCDQKRKTDLTIKKENGTEKK